jgi:hypothetical protein
LSIKEAIEALMAPVLDLTNSIEVLTARIVNIKESKEAVMVPVLSSSDSNQGLIAVLEKAADDCDFMAQLTYQGSQALQGYNLTLEEKAALLSGDLKWIEAHVGKLDKRLSTWLWCRLQQEIW